MYYNEIQLTARSLKHTTYVQILNDCVLYVVFTVTQGTLVLLAMITLLFALKFLFTFCNFLVILNESVYHSLFVYHKKFI